LVTAATSTPGLYGRAACRACWGSSPRTCPTLSTLPWPGAWRRRSATGRCSWWRAVPTRTRSVSGAPRATLRMPCRRPVGGAHGPGPQLPRLRAGPGHAGRLRRPATVPPGRGHHPDRQRRRGSHRCTAPGGPRPPPGRLRRRLGRGLHDRGTPAGLPGGLVASGLPFDQELVRLGCHDSKSAEAAIIDLLSLAVPPTAVFTGTTGSLPGAAGPGRCGHGPAAGHVAFDDFELAPLLSPPVTVVAHDPVELGRRAARLICERLDGDAGPPRRTVVPTRLIPRGSGEAGP